jgi:hypothetical protein
MQSSSLLPAASVRSFRVRAPRPAPPLTLVAAIVLLMLGGLAGAVALDWTEQPWLDSVVSGLRGALPWNWRSERDDAVKGPIAMPVRVPLDPIPAVEPAPIAVAEAPAPGLRRESDGGTLRAGGAPAVGAVSPSVTADAAGSGVAAGASGGPAAGSAASGPSAGADLVVTTGPSAVSPAADASAAPTAAPASVAGASAATVAPVVSAAVPSAAPPIAGEGSVTAIAADTSAATVTPTSGTADGQ